ncbi:PIN domain-containing protein [Salsipaludibacter albus]|uniref:PIN domain-containing protein n=1 Tax=Salsipaludibacter albus TaxID=2849650 RepID=UPI001EE4A7CD|nr:PIN domain-containing protein [Salsipaludibacter albus]
MRAFADTNVLVDAFDVGEVDKRAAALALLESPDHEFVVSAQVLNEFWVTVTRTLEHTLDDDVAADVVTDVSTAFEVVPVDAVLTQAGIARARADRLSLCDALVVEAARTGGCEILLTEDLDDGQSHDGVVVGDPFAGTG